MCGTWWRHQMEKFSASLALCAGNSPVPSGFPAQRPVTRNFDVFFDLSLNKRLSKQSWGWWSETPSSSLWRHSNEIVPLLLKAQYGINTWSKTFVRYHGNFTNIISLMIICLHSKIWIHLSIICKLFKHMWSHNALNLFIRSEVFQMVKTQQDYDLTPATTNFVGLTLDQRGSCRLHVEPTLHVGPTWAQRALLSDSYL